VGGLFQGLRGQAPAGAAPRSRPAAGRARGPPCRRPASGAAAPALPAPRARRPSWPAQRGELAQSSCSRRRCCSRAPAQLHCGALPAPRESATRRRSSLSAYSGGPAVPDTARPVYCEADMPQIPLILWYTLCAHPRDSCRHTRRQRVAGRSAAPGRRARRLQHASLPGAIPTPPIPLPPSDMHPGTGRARACPPSPDHEGHDRPPAWRSAARPRPWRAAG
jgi:hypothetical protein